MYYIIRVEFPDVDEYAFVLNDEGELKKFTTRELAETEAKKYAGCTIVQELEENTWW